jgi:hypothetical protein
MSEANYQEAEFQTFTILELIQTTTQTLEKQ